jgi:hypothetical protein
MSVPARITLITLGVADVARATAFYRALGWPLSSASQDSVSFFRTGGTVLALFGHADLAEDATLPATGDLPPYRGMALAINVGSEAEVDQVLADVVHAGGTVRKPAQRAFWGGFSGYFLDPDGHAWEVAHNPGFPFAPDGSIVLPE